MFNEKLTVVLPIELWQIIIKELSTNRDTDKNLALVLIAEQLGLKLTNSNN